MILEAHSAKTIHKPQDIAFDEAKPRQRQIRSAVQFPTVGRATVYSKLYRDSEYAKFDLIDPIDKPFVSFVFTYCTSGRKACPRCLVIYH